MMIAIVLFSLITLFLTSTLESLRVNSKILKEATKVSSKASKFLNVIQSDIQESINLKVIKGDNYVSIEMQTTNSLYNMAAPFVKWFVNPKTKQLIRSESASNTLPPFNHEDLTFVHLDLVLEHTKWFQAYRSKDLSSVFIGLKVDEKPLLLEILTPQHKL